MNKVAGRNLTDLAYQQLRAAILRGELAAGSVLGESAVARELGISKTPARQALQLLRTEGLLEVGPRRQLVVRGFSAAHRDEVLRIREALETMSVRTACATMSLDSVDLLRLSLLRQKRAADRGEEDAFLVLDEEFHVQIAAAAGLPIVARLLGQIRGFGRLMRLGRHQPAEHLLEIVPEHERIVDAIEARDADAAAEALHDHLHHWDYLLEPNEPSA
jgi:DNA-binding GntR family transcriptional regulator